MCLRFAFLLITRLAEWQRLYRREETWKTAEILILRHQLAVLQRRQPRRAKLNWADRALLAALLGVIPKARREGCGCWSPRTRSCAGTATSSGAGGRPVPSTAQTRPTGHPPEHQGPGPPAGAGEPRMGLPQDPRGAGRPGSEGSGVDRLGDPQDQPASTPAPRRTGPSLVAVPAFQAEAILACDFFSVDLLDGTQAYVLTVIEHATQAHPHPRSHPAPNRGVDHPAGTQSPNGPRQPNAPSQVHDPRPRLELHRRIRLGLRRLPASELSGSNVRTPRKNSIVERWIGGCRRELLDGTLIWNQHHLRRSCTNTRLITINTGRTEP